VALLPWIHRAVIASVAPDSRPEAQ